MTPQSHIDLLEEVLEILEDKQHAKRKASKRFDLPDGFTISQYFANTTGEETGLCYLDYRDIPCSVSWGWSRLRNNHNNIGSSVNVTREELIIHLKENYPSVFEFLLFHLELL